MHDYHTLKRTYNNMSVILVGIQYAATAARKVS
jgi:hypothetical protein